MRPLASRMLSALGLWADQGAFSLLMGASSPPASTGLHDKACEGTYRTARRFNRTGTGKPHSTAPCQVG